MKKSALKEEVEKVPTTEPKTSVTPTDDTIPQVEEVDNKISSSISLDDIARRASDVAPEPNEQAINRTNEKDKASTEPEKVRGSKPGVPRGKYNKSGTSTRSVVGEGKKSNKKEPQPETEKYIECYKAGAETADALVNLIGGVLGPEWGWMPPQKRKVPNPHRPGEFIDIEFDERTKGTDAMGKVYGHYGWGTPSPLMGLSMFVVGYVGIRLKNPEIKAKAMGNIDKLKLWFTKSKMERQQAQREREAKAKLELEQKPK